MLGTVFRSADGLYASPGAVRLPLIRTSVRRAPMPRRSAVAVPVSGATAAPLAPGVRVGLICGRLFARSPTPGGPPPRRSLGAEVQGGIDLRQAVHKILPPRRAQPLQFFGVEHRDRAGTGVVRG